jgi:hypothetical protein
VKKYTKYAPTSMLWALYLIVGVAAYFVSNFYFKFEVKDALIFGGINLVAVVIITEGIDWIFKKASRRQTRKSKAKLEDADETTKSESVVVEDNAVHGSDVEESDAEDMTTAGEPVIEETADDAPIIIHGSPKASNELSFLESLRAAPRDSILVGDIRDNFIHDTLETVDKDTKNSLTQDAKETAVDDQVPYLITGRPGYGKGYWTKAASIAALKNVDSTDSEDKEIAVESSEPVVSLPLVEDAITEQEIEASTKPRGRRANPEAVIDAPTSSIPIITPDQIKPTAFSAPKDFEVEPIIETPVAEPVVEEPYLTADEFLSNTKLTSPRAIVREYQRLGGKDDIYKILMERQK